MMLIGLIFMWQMTAHVLLMSEIVSRLDYCVTRPDAFGIIQHFILRFVNSWLLVIISYCSALILTWLLRKDFAALSIVLKIVNGMCGELFEVIVNVVVDRHVKFWKFLSNFILSDSNHSPYSLLSLWRARR